MRWLDSITDSMDMILSKLWEIVKDRAIWHTTVHGVKKLRHNLVTGQQQQNHTWEYLGTKTIGGNEVWLLPSRSL